MAKRNNSDLSRTYGGQPYDINNVSTIKQLI